MKFSSTETRFHPQRRLPSVPDRQCGNLRVGMMRMVSMREACANDSLAPDVSSMRRDRTRWLVLNVVLSCCSESQRKSTLSYLESINFNSGHIILDSAAGCWRNDCTFQCGPATTASASKSPHSCRRRYEQARFDAQ